LGEGGFAARPYVGPETAPEHAVQCLGMQRKADRSSLFPLPGGAGNPRAGRGPSTFHGEPPLCPVISPWHQEHPRPSVSQDCGRSPPLSRLLAWSPAEQRRAVVEAQAPAFSCGPGSRLWRRTGCMSESRAPSRPGMGSGIGYRVSGIEYRRVGYRAWGLGYGADLETPRNGAAFGGEEGGFPVDGRGPVESGQNRRIATRTE
jgi:hypothetical protein